LKVITAYSCAEIVAKFEPNERLLVR